MIKSKFWRFNGNESKYLNSIINNGFKFKKEPFSTLLEKKWSKIHKLKYSVTINSCTSALHIAFKSIGIKKGDEVIVPALTPIMCGTSVHLAGGTPVYCDVNKKNFLICLNDIERKITKKTKAILAVHMYSGICNLKELLRIKKKHNLFLIEDCAEAVGSKDQNNIITGTAGDISCWSFQSAKQITCGDGGIISTDNKILGKKIRKFSNLGFKILRAKNSKIAVSKNERQNPSYSRFDEIGFNYRLNEFSAAIALAQAERLEYFVKLRRKAARTYENILKDNPFFKIQEINKKTYSSYYTFAAQILSNTKKFNWKLFRKKFIEYGGDGIYAASKLIHQEPAIRKYGIGRCFATCKKNCVKKCFGTPNAQELQKSLLLFTTNQKHQVEINKQARALVLTLKFFRIY